MECPKCVSVIGGFAHLKSPAHLCTKCGLVFTDHQQSEIESLRAELSALKAENERLRRGLEKLGGKKSGKCLGCGAMKTYF
jgi:hypothetical protein